jgi:lipoprotein-anchoring transpeptidase ErfK/SrfK
MLRLLLVAVAVLGVSAPAYAAKSTLFDGLFGKKGGSSMSFGAPRNISGPIQITVDITTQEMVVATANGRTIYTFDVSTGRKGFGTPTGSFKPIRMHEMWYSSKYENAPMPHSIFFYGGYAIHATFDVEHLGQVASHGCVRLDPANAETLYELVKKVGMKNTSIKLIRS